MLVNPKGVLAAARAHAVGLRSRAMGGWPLPQSEADLLNAVDAYERKLRGHGRSGKCAPRPRAGAVAPASSVRAVREFFR
jgi:hypothetical protein